MRRIMSILAVVALMAAMVAASAIPAFADKGAQTGTGAGHSTQSGVCNDFFNLDCDFTTAGKEGNATGGPGRTDANLSSDISEPITEEDFIGLSGTSSGGGGQCEFDNTITESGPHPKETPRGKNAPCPGGVFGG